MMTMENRTYLLLGIALAAVTLEEHSAEETRLALQHFTMALVDNSLKITKSSKEEATKTILSFSMGAVECTKEIQHDDACRAAFEAVGCEILGHGLDCHGKPEEENDG